jgi:hypothetical protein
VKYILDLFYAEKSEGPWRESGSEFRALARSRGIDIRSISFEYGRQYPQEYFDREISNASMFLMTRADFFMGDKMFLPLVTAKIDSGTPLVVVLKQNRNADQSAFLSEFGIEETSLGLFAHLDGNAAHPRDVRILRSQFPTAFRDPVLFNGVNELYLDRTHAIRLHGATQSLFALPSGAAFCVDEKYDLPADWPAPEFTCIAGYYGRKKDRRIVVALNTELITDPFEDGLGYVHPRIRGDLSPVINTKGMVGFPYTLTAGRSIHEAQAIYRRTDHFDPQRA